MAVVLAAIACSSPPQRPERLSAPPAEECRDGAPPTVRLAAMAIALPVAPQSAGGRAVATLGSAVPTLGSVVRRVVVSAEPENLAPGVQMTWSRLSIRSFGGTFATATRLVTDFSSMMLSPSIQPLLASKQGRRREIVNVELSPGEIVVTRTALRRASLFGTTALDLAVTPGGAPVDDTIVQIPKLWNGAREAVPPRNVVVQLAPVRHPPGIDGIDAMLTLQYALQRGRARPQWRCTAEASSALLSKEDAQPPLWDLGISELNEARTAWLALYDDRLGPLRAIFDSPQAAEAFANWGRATRATRVGRFSIGLFTATPDAPLRPTVPVDTTIAKTLRPIARADWDGMRVGRLGEP